MDYKFVTDLSTLPTDIIIHILGYLQLSDFKNACVACKSWYYASCVHDKQIIRKLILQPTEYNFSKICKSNRRYGELRIKNFKFDKPDSHYFELFEKLCPFVFELHIIDSDLKINHLLKILELTTRLKVFALNGCSQLMQLASLFPLDYDCVAKNRVQRNLTGVNKLLINIVFKIPFGPSDNPLILDLAQCATSLESLTISSQFIPNLQNYVLVEHFYSVMENTRIRQLTDLNWNLTDFITELIKNLNLKSFSVIFNSNLDDKIYKQSRCLPNRLRKSVEFSIIGLRYDHISLICQHLVNLKCLECHLLDNDEGIFELAKLDQLEIIRIKFSHDNYSFSNRAEINQFFNSKFENLRILEFETMVTESNLLALCENHPNLLELKLTFLRERNLETIFKYLTKLRILSIDFGNLSVVESSLMRILDRDLNLEYEYKLTRLQDLEEFYLGELVNGIHEDDLNQLTKLRSTNLPKLFAENREEHNKTMQYLR